MNKSYREELERLAEPAYRDFSAKLIPGLPPEEMLGVRLPALRKLAQKLVREEGLRAFDQVEPRLFEEHMLRGMIIGCAPGSFSEKLPYIRTFLPEIGNWSVCDSFCSGLKAAKKEPEAAWALVQECLADSRPYFRRFALIMEKCYFLDREHLPEVLRSIEGVGDEDFYVKMGAGWCLAECYAFFPEETDACLRGGALERQVLRIALQKIRESRRVDAHWQMRARELSQRLQNRAD